MITSTANSQIKHLVLLMKKAKVRKEEGVFIVEGRKMFEEAPRAWIQKVYVAESFLQEEMHKHLLDRIEYEVLSDSVFNTDTAGDLNSSFHAGMERNRSTCKGKWMLFIFREHTRPR